MSVTVHQALHGYERGHRGLACSVELEMAERHLIDQLSDLSGYLTRGQDFDHYHTGYPAGRFYVLARTWLDRGAERTGTVLTHSLLLPRGAVPDVSDWGALANLFRRPQSSADREGYGRAIPLPDYFDIKLPLLIPSQRLSLGVGWFGAERRPMLWEDPDTAEAAARWLWAWLPSWDRAEHSFCTYALGPRWIGERVFKWLGAAPRAESAFYDLEARSIRAGGRRTDAGPQPVWATLFESDDGSAIQQVWRAASAEGISPQPETRLRLLLQRHALRQQTGLSAVLARLDGLERLGAAETTAAEADVQALIRALQDPPPPGRAVLTLQDVVLRAPHRLAPALEEDVADALAETMARFCPGIQANELDRLPTLRDSAAEVGLVEPLDEGLCSGFPQMRDDVQASAIRILDAGAPRMARRALAGLPPARTTTLVGQLLREASSERDQRRLVSSFLKEDPDLSVAVLKQGALPPLTLLTRLLGEGAGWSTEDWAALVSAAPPDDLLVWLSGSDGRISAPISSALIKVLLPQATLPLIARAPSSLRTELLARIAEQRADLLQADPVGALRLAAEQDMGHPVFTELVDMLTDEQLRVLAASMSESPGAPRWRVRFAARLIPVLLTDVLEGKDVQLSAWLERAGDALDGPATREVLARFAPDRIAEGLQVLALPAARELRSRRTLLLVMDQWAHAPTEGLADGAAAWAALLIALKREDRELYQEQCALALARTLADLDPRFEPVVLIAFPEVHKALCDKENDYGFFLVRWIREWVGGDWNKSKHLRRYMAEAMVSHRWPPSILTALSYGERWIMEDLIERIEDLPGGPAWLDGRR